MMKSKIVYLSILSAVSVVLRAEAISPTDFSDRLQVDMKADIPPIEELKKQFSPQIVYDTKYEYFWNIGKDFNKDFAQTIKNYGTRESRLKWNGEDLLLEQIRSMPKEYYQYIGPYLHTLPGISEKILELPGIKETKNKFPTRIAPQLKDIEDLEFLSPMLYFVLMPESWPDNDYNRERAKFGHVPQQNRYNAKLISRLRKIIPPQDYAYGSNPQEPLKSKLRTISPDAHSPLTSRDIQAVVRSMEALSEYGENLHNQSKIIEAGGYLDEWENSQGKGAFLPNIKDLVNPCQRLVQKIKMQNMDIEFSKIISAEGFNPEEWAYTCDKTIKAYRVLKMTSKDVVSVLAYRDNIYEKQLELYSPHKAAQIAVTMQSIVEMYKAPLHDVLEIKKNEADIKRVLDKLKYRLVFQPIYIK